jgi:NADH dehydrogenase
MTHIRDEIVTVFGGTGFLGSCVVQEAVKSGLTVRVAVRSPGEGLFLKQMAEVGQVELITASVLDPLSIEKALEGASYAVNCVGILFPKGSQTFKKIHHKAPEAIAKACYEKKIKRLVHVSAIGADPKSSCRYFQTKAQGEEAVLKNFKESFIVRPSVIFGPKDQFINRFSRMIRTFHMIPVIGGGKTLCQPVYVGDVAQAIVSCLITQDLHLPKKTPIFELGGPEVFTFRTLFEEMLKELKSNAWIISIPFPIASVIGFFTGFLFPQILSREQVKMLKKDNTVQKGSMSFQTLRIQPHSLKELFPSLLARFSSPQRTHPFSTVP